MKFLLEVPILICSVRPCSQDTVSIVAFDPDAINDGDSNVVVTQLKRTVKPPQKRENGRFSMFMFL